MLCSFYVGGAVTALLTDESLFLFRQRRMHEMRIIATDVPVAWCVFQTVCLSVTHLRTAKCVASIEVPCLGWRLLVIIVLDDSPDLFLYYRELDADFAESLWPSVLPCCSKCSKLCQCLVAYVLRRWWYIVTALRQATYMSSWRTNNTNLNIRRPSVASLTTACTTRSKKSRFDYCNGIATPSQSIVGAEHVRFFYVFVAVIWTFGVILFKVAVTSIGLFVKTLGLTCKKNIKNAF